MRPHFRFVSASLLVLCLHSHQLTATENGGSHESTLGAGEQTSILTQQQGSVKLDSGDVVVDDYHRGLGALFVDSRESVYCDESHFFASGANADCCRNWFWASAEYLYWHERGMEIPALVTSSTADTPRDQAGVLGQSTTTVLLGNERFVDDGQSGGRFSFGFWLDDCHEHGIDFVYTSLFDQSDTFTATSDQFSILGRPFFNVATIAEDVRVLGFPGEISGGVRVEGSTEYDVFEVLVKRTISRTCSDLHRLRIPPCGAERFLADQRFVAVAVGRKCRSHVVIVGFFSIEKHIQWF